MMNGNYEDTAFNWNELLKAQKKPTLVERIKLLISPWLIMAAPRGTVGCAYDFIGRPLYQYKKLKDTVFYLQPRKPHTRNSLLNVIP